MNGTHALNRRAFLGGGLALALGGAGWAGTRPRAPHTQRFPALGTWVTFVLVHEDGKLARHAMRQATADVFLVHEMMTRFEPSPLTTINALAHQREVDVPPELGIVLGAGQGVCRDSGGWFDLTAGALLDVPAGERAAWLPGVGPRNLEYSPHHGTVRLAHPRTRVDVNGIAKGYAVDRAVDQLRKQGIDNFVVNAGGDLYASGTPAPWATGWEVQVAPRGAGTAGVEVLRLRDAAVATSGNAAQREVSPGRHVAHLVDPRSGTPQDGLLSATVVASTAMDADAWATALFVAGEVGAPALVRAPAIRRAVLVSQDERVVRLG